jgi:hypothetical protein
MVAVRLARGWIGYGGTVHRAGELVDVDAVTLAKLEACGVVTPSESAGTQQWAGPTGEDPDEERTAAWAGPTGEPDDDDGDKGGDGGSGTWAGPTGDDNT